MKTHLIYCLYLCKGHVFQGIDSQNKMNSLNNNRAVNSARLQVLPGAVPSVFCTTALPCTKALNLSCQDVARNVNHGGNKNKKIYALVLCIKR